MQSHGLPTSGDLNIVVVTRSLGGHLERESRMTRVVKSFNGIGSLALRSGEVLPGRYHIDISYQPVRRIHGAQGHFLLDATPAWDSVVEAQFAGEGTVKLADGRDAEVTLGGITGNEVAITAMQPIDAEEQPSARNSAAEL
jgi:hypothetical protein